MKKKKIVVLFPLLGLLLSGCTFQEGFATAKSWVGSHIYHPAKDFIDGLLGKKDNSSGGDGDVTPTPTPDPDPTPTPDPDPTPTPANPEHKGTKEDPFTGKDACLVGAALDDETSSEDWYYVKGVVKEYNEAFDASFGSYSFAIEEGFKGYRLKNGEGREKFNENDIEIGDTVVMYGQIKRYRTTYEFDGTNNGKAYVVSVEKPAPEGATLESIKIEGTAQSAYLVGDAYNHSGLTVKAHYDKGEDQDVTAAVDWVFSKEKAEAGDTEITITAKFKDKEASLKVPVTVQSADKPAHAGTLEDPFTGLDAIIIAKTLQESSKDDRHPSEDSYYIKGVVQSFAETFDAQYGNFTFLIEGGFEGYRLLNGPDKAKFTSADQLAVGDTVTMYAQLLNFHGTYETEGGYIHSIEKPAPAEAELVSIAIEGEPQTEYISGADYNHKGLTVMATYDNEEKQEVTSLVDWKISKEKAEVGDSKITITADYKEKHAELEVTVEVVDSSEPVHAGTEDDPYTGADAVVVASKLAANTATEASFYIQGEVKSFEEEFNAQFGNYSFKIDFGFIGWRLKNGSEKAAFNEGDLEIGNIVTMYAQIQAYGDNAVPETKGGYIVEIVKEVVDVESVSLDKSELNMELGMPDETLVPTVLPDNATNKKVTWESNKPEVATVANGVVHAVAEGDAVITVKSKADPTKSATCTVHVSPATKTLSSIEVTTMPKVVYTEGETLDLSGMVVTLHYSDSTSAEITSGWDTSIALDHKLTSEDTSLVVSYGEKDADPIALTINPKPTPVHAGTAEDPYTVSDAKLIFDDLADGQINGECYVTGTIADSRTPSISGGRGRFDLTDGICETPLYVFNINNIGGSTNLTVDDIPVGSVVVAKGTIKNYGGTFELCYNASNPSVACELISVDKPVIAPTTVTVSGATSVQEEKTITLTASVGPVGAPQDVVWSVESGSEHASVDQNGVVTGIAEGPATIRATAVDHSDVYGEYNVTITAKPDTPSEEAYKLVTNVSDLADGSTIIISNNDSTYAMGAYADGNNVPAVAVTASDGVLEPGSASVLTLEDAGDGHFYIKLGDGYLYAAGSSKNYLKVKSAKDSANGVWEFSYADGHMSIVAYGSSNRNVMQYNPNSGSPIFACYASASQTALQVYRYC